jgi:cytochrome c biogenesis protein CcdA/glutaredoxin
MLVLVALAVAGVAASFAPAAIGAERDVTVVLFHGEGCPHCAAERAFLADLLTEHPTLRIEEHEVWYDDAGRSALLTTADRMGFEATGVPVTVIGDQHWIGFDDAIATQVSAAIDAALAGDGLQASPRAPPPDRTVTVPVLGDVQLDGVSLLASTLAIGFVDGVNPCSLWVLSLLLAMVLNRGSRGRVLLVGGVFLAVTAGMYGLYMLGMYSAASYLSGMVWLRVVVALIAGTFGILQLKDGLGIRTGPSLSISSAQRPGLYARMRTVAAPDGALMTTVVGTVALAVAVSLLETPCTAGLPLLWTTLLAEQGVGAVEAIALFVVYMAVFLLDEFIVFALAVIVMRAARVQERGGRALKLVAGSVLLSLAVTMLVAPAALTTIAGTLLVFGIAAAIASLAYLVSSGRSSGDRLSTPSTSSGSSPSTSRTAAKATDEE